MTTDRNKRERQLRNQSTYRPIVIQPHHSYVPPEPFPPLLRGHQRNRPHIQPQPPLDPLNPDRQRDRPITPEPPFTDEQNQDPTVWDAVQLEYKRKNIDIMANRAEVPVEVGEIRIEGPITNDDGNVDLNQVPDLNVTEVAAEGTEECEFDIVHLDAEPNRDRKAVKNVEKVDEPDLNVTGVAAEGTEECEFDSVHLDAEPNRDRKAVKNVEKVDEPDLHVTEVAAQGTEECEFEGVELNRDRKAANQEVKNLEKAVDEPNLEKEPDIQIEAADSTPGDSKR